MSDSRWYSASTSSVGGAKGLPRVGAAQGLLSASVSATLQMSARRKRDLRWSAFSRRHSSCQRRRRGVTLTDGSSSSFNTNSLISENRKTNSLLSLCSRYADEVRLPLKTGGGFVPSQHPGQAGPDHLLPDRRRGRGRHLHQRGSERKSEDGVKGFVSV